MEHIIHVLRNLRVNLISEEYVLQNEIALQICSAGVKFKREFIPGPRNRVDLFTDDGIAIEVKNSYTGSCNSFSQLNHKIK